MKVLEIDGTTLEGGGQLVRLAIGISALTGRAVKIYDIRGGRPRGGGLKNQHLTAVKWLAEASNAKVEGAELKSRTLSFQPEAAEKRANPWWKPRVLLNGDHVRSVTISLHNPGALTLVFQAILPFLLFSAPSTEYHPDDISSTPLFLTLEGGTNVPFAPSLDYFTQVLFPNLKLVGLPEIRLSNEHQPTRGWSTGRLKMGSVSFLIPTMQSMSPLKIPVSQGAVAKISITIIASGDLLRREIIGFVQDEIHNRLLTGRQDITIEVETNEDSGDPRRLYLLLVAHTENGVRLGRDWLYQNRIGRNEKDHLDAGKKMAQRVVEDLVLELSDGHIFDSYMEDQLVVFKGLAGNAESDAEGRKATLHTLTARFIVEQILGVKFAVNGSCIGTRFGCDRGCETEQETLITKMEHLYV